MMEEHDRIVLTGDFPGEALVAGDVGTVIDVHKNGEAYEVEFFTLSGATACIATIRHDQLHAVQATDISHARVLTTA